MFAAEHEAMKRPLSWQLEKQRTAKGLRELPKCEVCRIKRAWFFNLDGMWSCVDCAVSAKQRAQRERT